MIKPEQIPDEVVNAYMHMILCGGVDGAEVIAAAINAWPGAELDPYPQGTGKKDVVKWYLDLPLTQESRT